MSEKDKDRENTALILNEKRQLTEPLDEKEAQRRMRALSRRGFLIGGASAVFGALGYWRLRQPDNLGVFESTLQWNERLARDYFSAAHLAPEYPREMATPEPRINGNYGLGGDVDYSSWQLNILGLGEPITLNFLDLLNMPSVEMTAELKCIEGWSMIVNWTGIRFSDLVNAIGAVDFNYVSLVTPDKEYYVGWDAASILHPQTILAYKMNGEPLTPEHGAPLRLVSTVKYGIKQIKRIGSIEFTNERPKDYWHEQGYDWYSGL